MTQRIIITGPANTGKTTLGRQLAAMGFRHLETDITIPMGDPKQGGKQGDDSLEVSRWIDTPGPWVIEGVIAFRALRKWLARNHHSAGRPCDHIIQLRHIFETPSKGHIAQAKGIESVGREILPELLRRGVRLHTSGQPLSARDVQVLCELGAL